MATLKQLLEENLTIKDEIYKVLSGFEPNWTNYEHYPMLIDELFSMIDVGGFYTIANVDGTVKAHTINRGSRIYYPAGLGLYFSIPEETRTITTPVFSSYPITYMLWAIRISESIALWCSFSKGWKLEAISAVVIGDGETPQDFIDKLPRLFIDVITSDFEHLPYRVNSLDIGHYTEVESHFDLDEYTVFEIWGLNTNSFIFDYGIQRCTYYPDEIMDGNFKTNVMYVNIANEIVPFENIIEPYEIQITGNMASGKFKDTDIQSEITGSVMAKFNWKERYSNGIANIFVRPVKIIMAVLVRLLEIDDPRNSFGRQVLQILFPHSPLIDPQIKRQLQGAIVNAYSIDPGNNTYMEYIRGDDDLSYDQLGVDMDKLQIIDVAWDAVDDMEQEVKSGRWGLTLGEHWDLGIEGTAAIMTLGSYHTGAINRILDRVVDFELEDRNIPVSFWVFPLLLIEYMYISVQFHQKVTYKQELVREYYWRNEKGNLVWTREWEQVVDQTYYIPYMRTEHGMTYKPSHSFTSPDNQLSYKSDNGNEIDVFSLGKEGNIRYNQYGAFWERIKEGDINPFEIFSNKYPHLIIYTEAGTPEFPVEMQNPFIEISNIQATAWNNFGNLTEIRLVVATLGSVGELSGNFEWIVFDGMVYNKIESQLSGGIPYVPDSVKHGAYISNGNIIIRNSGGISQSKNITGNMIKTNIEATIKVWPGCRTPKIVPTAGHGYVAVYD